ncbi:MAG TPA: hypothetical protein V6D22_02045 [Candidatus Obscuribacterales bacterium]
MQGLAAKPYEMSAERFDTTVPIAHGLSLLPDTIFVPPLTDYTPRRQSRRVPMIVRVNRLLRTVLVTFCGLALLGYGLDVAASNEVAKLQEQARRLSEQNTELSAQLLRAISFQGIQANVVGKAGLRVPEHVLIVKEVQPPTVPSFKPNKYYLPLMSGY